MALGFLYMLPFLTICYLPVVVVLALILLLAFRYGSRWRMAAAALVALPLAPMLTTALVIRWGKAFGSQVQIGCLPGGICCNGAPFNAGIEKRFDRYAAHSHNGPALLAAE